MVLRFTEADIEADPFPAPKKCSTQWSPKVEAARSRRGFTKTTRSVARGRTRTFLSDGSGQAAS
jgi:hypothetical protein